MKRMCKVMEGRINEQMIRVAADLLRLGTVSKEDIARITGLSLETGGYCKNNRIIIGNS